LGLVLFSPLAGASEGNAPAFSSSAASILDGRPLLGFHTEPENPVVGKRLSFFVSLGSAFDREEPVLDGFLNGTPLRITASSGSLFVANLDPLSEVGSNTLRVDISLLDATKAQH
jgi:hypothetical protein